MRVNGEKICMGLHEPNGLRFLFPSVPARMEAAMDAAHVARSGLLAALVLGGALAGCGAGKSGVLDLSWTPPTTNTDGSPAGDVVAYRVYYGTQPSPCPGGPYITVPAKPAGSGQNVTARLTGLTAGEVYYIAVTAVSSSGAQSGCSAPASNRARTAP